jgi:hypothetical protein
MIIGWIFSMDIFGKSGWLCMMSDWLCMRAGYAVWQAVLPGWLCSSWLAVYAGSAGWIW